MAKVEKTEEKKYLRQMKELPPEEEPVKKPVPLKKVVAKIPPKPEAEPVSEDDGLDISEEAEYYEKPRLPLGAKDIVLIVINVVFLIVLIFLLIKFPAIAKELKLLRIEAIKDEQSVTFEFDKITQAKTRADEIQKYFVNDSGLVDFVNDLEKIKNENGTIKKVTFANQSPIKEKTGFYGLPVVIELQGSWEAIDKDLQLIDKLPYLFRAVKIEAGKPKLKEGFNTGGEETVIDPNVIEFKYGMFLYYDDSSIKSK